MSCFEAVVALANRVTSPRTNFDNGRSDFAPCFVDVAGGEYLGEVRLREERVVYGAGDGKEH